MNLDHCWQ